MKKINLKKSLQWSIVIGLIILAAVWAFRPRAVEVELGQTRRTTLVEQLAVEGRFRSLDRWIVTAIADGDLRRMPLEVGDVVKKGQAITEIYWDLRYVPLRAPQGGVVSRVYRESAGPVRRGDPIVEIVDPDRLEVIVELLTPEAHQIRVGNSALIEGWGGAQPLEATVSRVSRAGFVKNSALGVEEERTEVTLLPKGGGVFNVGRVGSQFHVDVVIETARTPSLLCAPLGAIFKDGERWATYVARDGRAVLKGIEVGRKNDQWVEIRSGLGEGESVVVYPGDLVRPGSRVRSQKSSKTS